MKINILDRTTQETKRVVNNLNLTTYKLDIETQMNMRSIQVEQNKKMLLLEREETTSELRKLNPKHFNISHIALHNFQFKISEGKAKE